MQDREKKLAIAFGAVLVIAFGLPMFERWFLQPITDANNELSGVMGRVETLLDQEQDLKLARRNLEDWQYESLPPNPFTAQREYQEWLMDLARMSGFSAPEPTLGTVPKKGRTFIEIPVTIEAKATLEQLTRFLYHFERVALLHRVQTLEVKSPASIGDPLLDVTILARGISLIDAPPHTRLFPTTTLSAAIAAADQTITVEPAQGFPTVDGFQVKIDEELLTVRKRGADEWTVERGAEQTAAVAHEADSLVELFLVDREAFQSGRSFDEYSDLLQNSPFTKPSPPVDYKLQLSPTTPQIVTRGTPWTLKLSLSGWDPSGGPAVFTLGDGAPQGLTIDAQTGELSWTPETDVEAKTFDVSVTAKSEILSGQQVGVTLPVTLREPNLPPTIETLTEVTAFSGRPLSIPINAVDPDGEDGELKFSLSGDVPTGAEINEQTGELTWVPPLTLELGEYALQVAVADSGDPSQTTTQQITVKLEDDAALFTRLVGFFQNDGTPEVMLSNLTSGETTRVTLGAKISAAEISGTIVEIEPTYVLLKIGDDVHRLDMGQSLRQMTPVETVVEGTDPASGSG